METGIRKTGTLRSTADPAEKGGRRTRTARRKAAAILAAALLALSLAACGKGGQTGEDKAAEGDSFVYVPRYIPVTQGEGERISGICGADGKVYYSVYGWNQSTGESSEKWFRYDIAADSTEEITFAEDAGEELKDASMQRVAADSQGSLYMLYQRYNYDENNPENSTQDNLLVKRDASGAVVYFKDISEDFAAEDSYVEKMAVDAEGRVCLMGNAMIQLYDAEGNFSGTVELKDNWVSGAATGKDGRVYIAYNDYTGEKNEFVIAPVDFQGKKLGDAYRMQAGGNGLAAGAEHDFLMQDGMKLSAYDSRTNTVEEVLEWLDCNINGDYVEFVCAAGEGKLFAMIRDWESDATEFALLTKTKASEAASKEEIVIGAFGVSQELRSAAVNFNKSNEKYAIKIREYWNYDSGVSYEDAIAKMNGELLTDNCPDILVIGNNSIDVESLAKKGAFVDLNGFLDKSSVFGREDFVESVLRASTWQDMLVAIPKSFTITAVAGKTSQVGDKMGWTLRDVMDFAAGYPDAELFEWASRGEMTGVMMMFNQSKFIDWEKGSCNFNSDEFKQILEFAAGFPEEYDYSGDRPSMPARLASGDLLLYTDAISDCNTIQMVEAMFGEPVTWIGFPTLDGRPACVMDTSESYAILAKSKKQEGAWEFIESSLNEENRMFSWGLPSRKDRLEEKIAEAMKVEYVTDENGEPVLDENGEPILQGSTMMGIGFGDWEYTYKPCSEEEIAMLRRLIDIAEPLPRSNEEILKIINEEAESFFQGQKSLDEVADTIQRRAAMYVSENS